MKPYYEHAGITIYHGDAAVVLPDMAGYVLVTDPPYGVALGADKDMRGGKHGLGKSSYHGFGDTYAEWVR